MTITESTHVFDCAGQTLSGVLASPAEVASDVGVVIVVGGPQYRVGSHRQFVLLSRALAGAGYPVLRFDTRGMGDASGSSPGFEALDPDLDAAISCLLAEAPSVRRVVLWGLCDGASACLLYVAHAPDRVKVAGLVLLNPWVRNEVTFARAQVKTYYGRRVFEPAFWRKLIGGKVQVWRGVLELADKVWRMFQRGATLPGAGAQGDFRERMVSGLLDFPRPVLFVLSGRDHTCAEFLEFVGMHPRLRGLWKRTSVVRVDLPDADHTFSNARFRSAVATNTLGWLEQLTQGRQP